jgi:hypothetical protein
MQKIFARLTVMTPHEIYLQRVNAQFEAIRKENRGFDYTPAQFGGIFGQQVVNSAGTVLELTEFEVK